ncbi:ribosome silencing factor [bacterium]|nr:ribosome silencing factor [bacterium]
MANAKLLAQIASDYRGQDTLLLDMRKITPIVDYFVITTATSNRQMNAMAEEADRVMKKRGLRKLGGEGDDAASVWLLRDYGDAVLHVFTPEGRELYDLEGLWADARRVEWATGRPVPNASGSASDEVAADSPAE